MKTNYEYSKIMVMKLILAKPNFKGGSDIWLTFERALDIIKQLDNMTQKTPKLIYLIGWQYCGHDDGYPAFFEVNNNLKRKQDKTALESLLWLIEEAKKYNTTISFHINLSDAYPDSPLWDTYIKNDLILRRFNGSLKSTGSWYGRKAYQVRFAKEFESGFFKDRVDKLLKTIPVQESKTIHVDAFFARRGKNTTIQGEKDARRKMIEYFNYLGIDVTSEFIYREKNCGIRMHFGKSDVIGLIPYFWKVAMSQKEFLKYPVNELSGGEVWPSIQRDKDLVNLFYANMHGEEIIQNIPEGLWQKDFIEKFITYNLPYHFLNNFNRLKIVGIGKNRIAYFSNDIRSEIKGKKIFYKENLLKDETFTCLPLNHDKKTYIAYSFDGGNKNFYVVAKKVQLFYLDENGKKLIGEYSFSDNLLKVKTEKKTAYCIEIVE